MKFCLVFLVAVLAWALCGCVNERQAAIDQAYLRGEISYAQKRRLTDELSAERTAAREASMREFQQQPRDNPNYRKLVNPQPVEDLSPTAQH